MANGNGNGNGISMPPWKVIGLAITASLGISGISMDLISDRLEEHATEIAYITAQLAKGERYTEADAQRDFQYANQRMNRIETSDAECAKRINEHIRKHP